MSFRSALTQLALLTVAGVNHNYDVDEAPNSISRAALPSLIILPIDTSNERLFAERAMAYEALAFSDGARTASFVVTHLLLMAPAESGVGLRAHLPALVTLMDMYLVALSADPLLNGELDQPTRVQVEPGLYQHGGVTYYGCAFRHRWIIALESA